MPLSATLFGSGAPVVLLPGFALDGAVMAAACEPAFAGTPGGHRQRIYLDLHVTVAKEWQRDPKQLRKLGFDKL